MLKISEEKIPEEKIHINVKKKYIFNYVLKQKNYIYIIRVIHI